MTTTTSSAFTDQLNTTGNIGPVTSTGWWNGPHRLLQRPDHHDRHPGGRHLHGDRDHGRRILRHRDLHLHPHRQRPTIAQTTPTSGSVTVTGSSAFTDQLNTTGGIGPVTFAGGGAGLTVSSSGQIATTGTLAAGTYTATGTTADAFGDTGTFTYTLTVGAITLPRPRQPRARSRRPGRPPSPTSSTRRATTGRSPSPVVERASPSRPAARSPRPAPWRPAPTRRPGPRPTPSVTPGPSPIPSPSAPSPSPRPHPLRARDTALTPFTDQLTRPATSDGHVHHRLDRAGLTVSASGTIATPAPCRGQHTATGTTADAFGDTGKSPTPSP